MYHPTTRVLAVLELLQVHRRLSGAELAERLEVDRRTVRRYVTILQDLGIPIEGEPGRHGGYRLRPNFALPPLLFSEDEATALALGLLAARRTGFAADPAAVEGALAKVARVLPAPLREQVLALRGGVALDLREAAVAPQGALVVSLGAAAQLGRRVRLRYRARGQGESERLLDPYAVVYHAAVWYVVGHCHLRGAIRLFRLDRIAAAAWCGEADRFARPADFDGLAYVRGALASVPRDYAVVVTLLADAALVEGRLPPGFATLEETEAGTVLRCATDSLRRMAALLVGLDCDFVVQEPPELREALRELAAKVARLANGVDGEGVGRAEMLGTDSSLRSE